MAFQGIGSLLSFKAPSLRIALFRGEALSLPLRARTVRVLSGSAWLSIQGRDVILGRTESLDLAPGKGEAVVVSALGTEGLSFEVE